jgi:hypothetical protein
MKKDVLQGQFDNLCGQGRPELVLSGHSQGGGEAQFAAVRNGLKAIVFNSAPVNTVIFSDWTLLPHVSEIARVWNSLWACHGQFAAESARYVDYMRSGNIRDIRMVNDPLTLYLFPICRELAHAPFEWLKDNSTCSSDGHGIETVVRELRACGR